MSNHEELLLTLSEARNAVAYCERAVKVREAENEKSLRHHKDALLRATTSLSEIESEVLRAMDEAGTDSLHSAERHFTAYVHDTSGYRVIDEEQVIAALTERGEKIPWQKPPKPRLNQTKAKQLAADKFGGDLPGIEFVEHRTVQVKGTER